MRKIAVDTVLSQSEIAIGDNWQQYIADYLKNRNVVIVTDTNINNIYSSSFPPYPTIVISRGEENKELSTIEFIIQELLSLGLDRSGFVLGIGGGVVCDIVGFAASIYMRGIDFGFVATTLLSQADASIGGKNGVNFNGIKNIVGVINQPRFVYSDVSMLSTLSSEDFLSGVAEILKIGFIGDSKLIDFAEQNRIEILARNYNMLEELIYRAAKFKARLVAIDEKEHNQRRILNFGHTYGHAIELTMGCKHGLAVAAGMKIAARLSVKRGLLTTIEMERIVSLLNNFGLDQNYNIDSYKLHKLILHDKKRENGFIHFILLSAIGSSTIQQIDIEELELIV